MKTECPFAELVALEVGGDLEAQETVELSQHLDECATCQDLRTELEADRHWIQQAGSFQANDLQVARMRQGVLAQIDSQPHHRWPWHAGLAALAAGLLLALGIATWSPPSVSPSVSPSVPRSASSPTTAAPKPSTLIVHRPPESEALNRLPDRAPEAVAPEATRPGDRALPGAPRNPPDLTRGVPPTVARATSHTTNLPEQSTIVFKLIDDENDLVFYWLEQ